jgi:hypothetical protein
MSIDYIVKVEVPAPVLAQFGETEEFKAQLAHAVRKSSSSDMTCGNVIWAEFDDLDNAKQCETALDDMLMQFEGKRIVTYRDLLDQFRVMSDVDLDSEVKVLLSDAGEFVHLYLTHGEPIVFADDTDTLDDGHPYLII